MVCDRNEIDLFKKYFLFKDELNEKIDFSLEWYPYIKIGTLKKNEADFLFLTHSLLYDFKYCLDDLNYIISLSKKISLIINIALSSNNIEFLNKYAKVFCNIEAFLAQILKILYKRINK